MDIYKQALQQGITFQTPKGILSTQQLFKLSLADLANSVKHAKNVLNEKSKDDELDFLSETSTVSKEDQLVFDVLKDVYLTKKAERDAVKEAASIKEHNEKILGLIYAKQEQALGDKSLEELEAMLK